ncbi:MAG: aminoacetone oxidase family FAD-binding enzyme [Deferribacterales bacterium]|nr:aminoacetone oxidase family FAD-binding enzyme [Deferribacterales bacterium]
MKDIFDFALIGAGASGLFALRGLKNYKVVIIDKNPSVGAKLLITGGKKCNFTNKNLSYQNFISSNPHFVKSFLAKFNTQDILDIVLRHKIPYEERDNGKLFTLTGADKLLNAILQEGKSNLHQFKLGYEVKDVSKNGQLFKVITDKGTFTAKNIIVASGGMSFPKLGATGIAYKIAEKFAMTVIKTAPALTSLKYPKEISETFSSLSGISLKAQITVGKTVLTDNLLFSHTSFSGPLALNVSLFVDENPVIIDFVPDLDLAAFLKENRNSKKALSTLLSYHIPKALVKGILQGNDYNMSKISNTDIEKISKSFKEYKIFLNSKDGYHKAEVTKGGVSVDDVFPSTMESRQCKGLFFIGEALDVTGMLGGYNLHWAWASAYTFTSAIENNKIIY